MLTLSEAERAKGVIAVSAGNHAQGVAYHAQRMGVPAVIVMPRFTPTVKVANTRRFGAEVVLAGDTFDDAKARGYELAQERGLIMIHPTTTRPSSRAGHGGTGDAGRPAAAGHAGRGHRRRRPDLGIATAAKALKPGIEIVGVQTERFPSMYAALKGVTMPQAVHHRRRHRREIARRYHARGCRPAGRPHRAGQRERYRARHRGAAGDREVRGRRRRRGRPGALLRAQEEGSDRYRGKRIGLVLTGGNIDPLMLGELIERGMVRAGRLARIRVDLRDLPGALAHATKLIADAQANITEVHHQRAFTSLPVRNVEVDFVLQTGATITSRK